MKKSIFHLVTGTALALALSASSAYAQKKYDTGATDTEIKIGQTNPFSGPASAYATIGKTQAAYMKMINDQGGVNGRKINLIQYDDAYSPPKAVEQVRKLVESDEVLLTFQLLGTPSNAAGAEISQLEEGAATVRRDRRVEVHRPEEFPWTMGFNPNYFVEGRIYGQYIMKEYPNAKIGILYQNDDLGKDYLNGIKAGLGDKAAKMIVAKPPTKSPIRPSIRRSQDQGRRRGLFFSATTPSRRRRRSEDHRNRLEAGAHPRHQRDLGRRLSAAAGLEASRA
jgi:ABC-type branched-subunit amino acid transport system substrate-binding protein